MKLKVFSVMILFLGTFFLDPVQADYSKYVDSEGQVSDLVVRCLNLSGIAVEGEGEEKSVKNPILMLKSRALKDVVDLVQGRTDPGVSWWIRGVERWMMFNSLLTPQTARQILTLGLEEFQFNKPVYPNENSYEGLLILGTDAVGVQDRVLFSNELINRGTKVKTVYILTGKRKLEDFERKAVPYLTADDEGQMVQEILQKEAIPALKKSSVVYSEPPEGSPRATTESTVEAFMELSPKHGNYLCVSDGIFIPYQELVIQNTLDKNYPDSGIRVQCVGPAEKETFEAASDEQVLNYASVFLDNLSRILYNLEKRQENKNASF